VISKETSFKADSKAFFKNLFLDFSGTKIDYDYFRKIFIFPQIASCVNLLNESNYSKVFLSLSLKVFYNKKNKIMNSL